MSALEIVIKNTLPLMVEFAPDEQQVLFKIVLFSLTIMYEISRSKRHKGS